MSAFKSATKATASSCDRGPQRWSRGRYFGVIVLLIVAVIMWQFQPLLRDLVLR